MYGISFRKKTNKKSKSLLERKPKIDSFLQYAIYGINSRKNGTGDNDPKYGIFSRLKRYHMDQVPLMFDQFTRTYEITGTKHVWIKNPKVDMSKRLCTLQLCFCAQNDKNVVKPSLIFRCKPQDSTCKIPKAAVIKKELSKYHPDVVVYFQCKAWADQDVSLQWLKDFRLYTNEQGEVLLGLDNLGTQKTQQYQEYAVKHGIDLIYTPESCTDAVAVTDRNLGQLVKRKMHELFKKDFEANVDDWINGKITASQRRIKYTHWLGTVWKEITSSPEYISTVFTAFQRCGMCNAKDGSDNKEVKIDGLDNYVVSVPGDHSSNYCAMCWSGTSNDNNNINQTWIDCEVCSRWFHVECTQDSKIKKMTQSQLESATFKCEDCAVQLYEPKDDKYDDIHCQGEMHIEDEVLMITQFVNNNTNNSIGGKRKKSAYNNKNQEISDVDMSSDDLELSD